MGLKRKRSNTTLLSSSSTSSPPSTVLNGSTVPSPSAPRSSHPSSPPFPTITADQPSISSPASSTTATAEPYILSLLARSSSPPASPPPHSTASSPSPSLFLPSLLPASTEDATTRLNSRTKKRHRGNAVGDESAIAQRTVQKLFDAQRDLQRQEAQHQHNHHEHTDVDMDDDNGDGDGDGDSGYLSSSSDGAYHSNKDWMMPGIIPDFRGAGGGGHDGLKQTALGFPVIGGVVDQKSNSNLHRSLQPLSPSHSSSEMASISTAGSARERMWQQKSLDSFFTPRHLRGGGVNEAGEMGPKDGQRAGGAGAGGDGYAAANEDVEMEF